MAELLSFSVFKTRNKKGIFCDNPDPRWCAAGCHGERTSYWQCPNKGTKKYGGHVWCGIHYPPSVHARRAERDRQYKMNHQARTKMRAAEEADRKRKDRALEAIKLIAAGHNNPIALAREVLGQPEEEET